jgi:lipopolysaccharide transport system ATP-binding protein
MPPVIQVENLSKLYRLGEVSTGTLSHDLNRWWHKVRGKEDPYLKIGQVNDRTKTKKKAENLKAETRKSDPDSGSDFSSDYVYALKDINFSVNQGEVLGIIGRNGAGKSTLLKILSRVTAPTSGGMKVKGRIASLLEVGTGFHPELTGRENIYLNGAILGMRRHEISSKLDEIVDFSGCAAYLDTPVKRYSRGMYVRLAFAVAAHLESEILILDEVLAVGDARFQERCMGRMNQVASTGRTVLFVSHNMPAVRKLCSRSVLLVNGKLAFSGDTSQAIDRYLQEGSEQGSLRRWERTDPKVQDEVLRLRRVQALSKSGENSFYINKPLALEIEFDLLQDHEMVSVSIHLHTQEICAFVGGFASIPLKEGTYQTTCEIPAHLLNDTTYSLTVFLITDATNFRVIARDAIQIKLEEQEDRIDYLGTIIGTVRPNLRWETSRI